MTFARVAETPRTWKLLLLLAAVALLVHAWSFGFVIDDAYISFRYARNLVDGHGLVFNPGETVEGYTNFSWVILSALGIALGVDPLTFARVLGALATLGTLLLATRAVRTLAPDGAPLGAHAALLLAASGPLACWTLAGLETPLVAALATAAWLATLTRRPLLTGALALALALTRPDGAALGAAFLLWCVVVAWRSPRTGRERRRAALGVGLFAAGIAAHFLWRHHTYGAWLPNTFHAKTGDLGAQVATGIPYVAGFFALFALPWFAVAAWASLRDRRAASPELLGGVAVVAAWSAYVLLVGGDGLGMYRFLVPVLPMVIVIGVAFLARVTTRVSSAVTVVVVIAAAIHLSASFTGRERKLVAAHMTQANLGGWIRVGDTLARLLPKEATIALAPVGYIPYRTNLVTFDILGLTDAHIARRDMPFEVGYAGHEKHDGAYILARRPHYLLLGNVDVTEQPRRDAIPPFRPELDIYRHPDFPASYVAASIPLDGGGYVNLFMRRDLALAARGASNGDVPAREESASE